MIIGRDWVIQWLNHRPMIQQIIYSHHDMKLPSTQENIGRQSEEPFGGLCFVKEKHFPQVL